VSELRLEAKEIRQKLTGASVTRDVLFLLVSRLIEVEHPEKKICVRGNETVEVTESDGKIHTVFLGNLLAECLRSPDERVETVERYLRLLVGKAEDGPSTRDDIVAIVRHVDYRQVMKQDELDVMTEHLIGDLWMIYAIDRPQSTSIMTVKDMEALGVDISEMKSLGIKNVSRLLEDLEFEEHGHFSVLLSANSVYLSSTLLLDHVWDFLSDKVTGDLVVAVPARDTVIFCGSK